MTRRSTEYHTVSFSVAMRMERNHQREKFGGGCDDHSLGDWSVILAKEYGDVSQALKRLHFPSAGIDPDATSASWGGMQLHRHTDLIKEQRIAVLNELVHMAAVAEAMAEQLQREIEGED